MGGLRKVIVEYLKHMNTVSVPILALPLQHEFPLETRYEAAKVSGRALRKVSVEVRI